jgi:hypothetical protein
VRRGAAAESRGEPENPGIGLGDPERELKGIVVGFDPEIIRIK